MVRSAFIAEQLCLNYLDEQTVSASARRSMTQGLKQLLGLDPVA
jgi:hypothetical protein